MRKTPPGQFQGHQSQTAIRIALIVGLLIGASVLGVGAITSTGGQNHLITAAGVIIFLLLGGIIVTQSEIPVIGLVRIAFIASFFFKGDVSLFKIDEIEDPSGLNISLTLVSGLILLIYDHVSEGSQDRVFPNWFSVLVLALFVFSGISVVYAGPTVLSGFSLLSVVTSILVAYATASHFGRRDRLIQLVIGIAAGLLFTGIVAISQFTFDFPTNLPNFGTGTEDELIGTQSESLSRVPAFLRTPTEMAWVLTSLTPFVLAPLFCRVRSFKPSQRIFMTAAVLAGTVGVILSLARGSWIGLALAIPGLALFGWFRLSAYEKKEDYAAIIAVVFLAAIFLTPFAGKIYDRFTQDDEGSAHIRIPMMEVAFRMIDDNPVVGVGLGGYRHYMTKYDESETFVSKEFPNPVHNVFAHITAEIGIPGGIVFCLLILFCLYECFKSTHSSDRFIYALAVGLSFGLMAFVISGLKEPGSIGSVRPPIRTCFFLFGAILAVSRISKLSLR